MALFINLLGVTNKLFVKKSGASEKDILVNVHAFFEQDECAPFNLEYAWRILKDEPKWMGASTGNSSKRTKNSVSGAYTTSPNSETPSSYEFNSSSPRERPLGQKEAKRKGKAKENSNATEPPSSVRIGESTAIEFLERFVRGVNEVFGAEYLRRPNNNDVEHLLQMGESRGFPSMLGSIDCSNNDINVLNQSNVLNDILEERAATVQYTINGTLHNMGYYLADARAWHIETLKHTIYACIILHNMIVEDERHTYGGDFDYSYDNACNNNSTTETFNGPHPNLATRIQRRASLREKQVHRQLQGDLVEHNWERFGHEDEEI
ncbi:uncharacterized protein LOC131658842 [Vicia villosa]|uniref:uncharacterized protein LOC131658842 n=1 Tax=Vicia villosa TaxID=3911 RepID=UPI00273B866D|nr:uncharacterized protein LOC131658842 [Vicia villosa]